MTRRGQTGKQMRSIAPLGVFKKALNGRREGGKLREGAREVFSQVSKSPKLPAQDSGAPAQKLTNEVAIRGKPPQKKLTSQQLLFRVTCKK